MMMVELFYVMSVWAVDATHIIDTVPAEYLLRAYAIFMRCTVDEGQGGVLATAMPAHLDTRNNHGAVLLLLYTSEHVTHAQQVKYIMAHPDPCHPGRVGG